MEALRRIKAATIERRLLNSRGEPNFNVNFYVAERQGRARRGGAVRERDGNLRAVHGEGAESRPLEPLLPGSPN